MGQGIFYFLATIISNQIFEEGEMLRELLRKSITSVLSIVLIGSASLTAFAEEPPKAEEPWYKQIDVSGFVDVYYSYNFNRPLSMTNGLRNFDFDENQFKLSLAELVIQKAPSPVGFRIDLDYGPTTDFVHSVEPNNTNIPGTTGLETFKNIQQAYVSWTAPIGKGLTIDFGKFVTHMGSEVIESKDNWNYSRSFLFSWAIPYYHAGVRASYPVSDKLTVNDYLYNGWNNVTDTNNAKTFGYSIVLNPMAGLTIVQNWIGGAEGTSGANWRHVWDTIVTYAPTDKLAFMLDYDYGTEKSNTGVLDPRWTGIAGYVRFAPNDWLAFIPRVEWYRDNGGFTTGAVSGLAPGASQTLYEVTWTNEFKIHKNLLTRVELRRDMSDGNNAFQAHDGTLSKNHQETATVGVVYTF